MKKISTLLFLIILINLFSSLLIAKEQKHKVHILPKNEYKKISQNFTPIDISDVANMGFADDKPGDGKGGWSDEGDNDVREFMYIGDTYFHNILFNIIDPEKNNGKTCLVLRGQNKINLPTKAEIKINKKAKGIYFLHSAVWSSDLVGSYKVIYEDNIQKIINIHDKKEIYDWWHPNETDKVKIAWKGSNPLNDYIAIYLYAWANPHPDKKIKTIIAQTPGNKSCLILVGLTLTDKGPFFPKTGKSDKVCFSGKNYSKSRTDKIKTISSPNKNIKIKFILNKGVPFYSISFKNKQVIKPSSLGFQFNNAEPLQENFKILKTKKRTYNKTWKPVWGTDKEIKNHYNEIVIYLQEKKFQKRKMDIIFRAYNDGIGFYYNLPKQKHLQKFEIISEETYFQFSNDHTAWWIPHNYDSYEQLYTKSLLSEINGVNTPVTIETKNDLYLSIHEANLTDYAGMTLVSVKDMPYSFKSVLVPWPDDIKVKAVAPHRTPWRTIHISDNPGDLIESHLILNLNEPCRIKDTTWIKPMKYMGIWWGMHIGKTTWHGGKKHGATTENAKYYIDFASKHGIKGLLIEGWNTGWENWGKKGAFNFLKSYPDFNLKKVVTYAREKGVMIIGHHETGGDVLTYEKQMDEAFKLYSKTGVTSIKTGYAGRIRPVAQHHHGQWMVNHYRRVVKKAAKYKIMIDAHEPIKDTGISRTYPNMMTREGVRGLEYNAWSEGNPPEHTTILPFTRMLSGPLDYTPGTFDIKFDKYKKKERIRTTIAKQLALYVILYSPLQMASDLPENYENQHGFEFIKKVPVTWDKTKVLNAKIGDYVTIARKKGETWFIGSITDEYERNFVLSLNFLKKGKKYLAEIFKDGQTADWKNNPTEIEIQNVLLEKNDKLKIHLKKGGGQALIIRPATQNEIKTISPYSGN